MQIRVHIGILTKIAIVMFFVICIARIWIDVPYAIVAIPLFIDWIAIPSFYHIRTNAAYAAEQRRITKVLSNPGGRAIHWDYKNNRMFEDEN